MGVTGLLSRLDLYSLPLCCCSLAADLSPMCRRYKLLLEGTGLQNVMGADGVNGYETYTNNIMEIEKCLGIEAARSKIISEIQAVMGAYGMSIDSRHTMLLADCMTFRVGGSCRCPLLVAWCHPSVDRGCCWAACLGHSALPAP